MPARISLPSLAGTVALRARRGAGRGKGASGWAGAGGCWEEERKLHGWSGRRGFWKGAQCDQSWTRGLRPMAWLAGARLPGSQVRLLSPLGHRGPGLPALCSISAGTEEHPASRGPKSHQRGRGAEGLYNRACATRHAVKAPTPTIISGCSGREHVGRPPPSCMRRMRAAAPALDR